MDFSVGSGWMEIHFISIVLGCEGVIFKGLFIELFAKVFNRVYKLFTANLREAKTIILLFENSSFSLPFGLSFTPKQHF